MSDEMNNLSEREQIEALLPWYERGQLDPADMERVEAYLAAHPEMADQLALIEEERGETVLLNEARGAPRPGALDRLMDAIEAHEAANPSLASTKKAVWGWASRLVGAPVPASLQWVAAAAAVLIVVQGVSLGVLMTSALQGPGYETASGPTTRGIAPRSERGELAGTFALVRFADEARAEDINKFLTEEDFTIVEGPRSGGVFRLRISDAPLDDAERDTILKELSARTDLISFAAPAR